MTNPIQLRRSTTPGAVPALEVLVAGELAVNLIDKDLYMSTGLEVFRVNDANVIRENAAKRFVTDAQIAAWSAGYTLPTASSSVLGGVKIGSNINVDGDGVISLNVASATNDGVLTAADWATFNGKQDALGFTPVNKAGDTLTGDLVLAGAPTVTNGAATKGYVDSGLAAKLDLAGGTLTGPLTLASNPVANLDAATKQYVDLAVNDVSGHYGAPVQDVAELTALDGVQLNDKMLRLVEDIGAIYRYDAQSVIAADGDGVVLPVGNVGRWIKVSAAIQNHELLTGLQGGAAGDHLHLTTAEKNGYDAHLANYDLHLTADQNTWLDGINASTAEVNWLVGVTSSVQDQINSKQASLGFTPVNKAGDTMLGALTLAGDPVAALDAVTKQYVDNRTIDGGTF